MNIGVQKGESRGALDLGSGRYVSLYSNVRYLLEPVRNVCARFIFLSLSRGFFTSIYTQELILVFFCPHYCNHAPDGSIVLSL